MRRGFTLLELLVVVSIIAVLIAIMVPSLNRARAATRLTGCAGNLRAIGQAMQVYASSERVFATQPPPRLASKMGKWSTLSPPTGPGDADPLSYLYYDSSASTPPNYLVAGEPMGNPWIVVLQGTVKSKQFICPSDLSSPIAAPLRAGAFVPQDYYLNFSKLSYSYSFAYPWVSVTGPVAVWWRGGADGSRVIAADIGPSLSLPLSNPNAPPGNRAGNSQNHGGVGQQVLLADAHVEFSKTNIVGRGNDNIYSADHGNIVVKAGGTQFTTAVNLNANELDVILAPARP